MSSALSVDNVPRMPGVEADLQFLELIGEKLQTYTFNPPGGGPRSNARYTPNGST